jgi:gamma-glutamyltranspeptidase/glutathione hydrolase
MYLVRRFSILFLLFLTGALSLSVYAQSSRGMAATAHPLATKAALEMLQKGGNAVDAAVAAAFAIGVVEPDGSGIGGGGGMVIYLNDTRESHYINYYARASEHASEAGFSGRNDARSGKSVCIPGTVAGLCLAQEEFGSLPLETLLEPAIRYAEEGFKVDAVLSSILLDNIETLYSDENTKGVFTLEGFPYMEGDLVIQKELAETLREIARKGRKGFYQGSVAKSLVKGLNEREGTQTLKDFKSYRATLTEALKGDYRGYEVLTAMPPQAGVTLVEALNILENHPSLSGGPHFSKSAEALHLIAETQRLVSADRFKYVGDPDYITVPLSGLSSKAYAEAQYKRIDPTKVDPPYGAVEAGNPYPYTESSMVLQGGGYGETNMEFDGGGHTTHLSVIDSEGNAVSLTQTLGLFFGSGQMVNGVLFNCAMTNFSYRDQESPNYFIDGKMPRSTIMPAILLKDDSPFLVIGSPGAGRIISTMIEVVVNVTDYAMDVEQANLAPRFHITHSSKVLDLESGVEPGVREKLGEMGHVLNVYDGIDLYFGGVQMILVDQEKHLYYGSADKRRGGSAEGY